MRIGYSLSQSGLRAQQAKMDQIAHDIANVNTIGYKSKKTSFKELLINDVTAQDVLLADGTMPGQGRGVLSGVTGTSFTQGNFQETQENFHLAIAGEGFFQVTSPDGQVYLTRDGAFQVDGTGTRLVNSQGHDLDANLTLPVAQWPNGAVSISENGNIQVGAQTVGVIPLYLPENKQALQPVGGNYFAVDAEAGLVSTLESPALFGGVQQGFIEQSNVDLAKSMTEMIIAQRAYSLNAQVTKSTDEIYQTINNFRS